MSSSVSENQGNTVACTLLDEGAVEKVSRRVANRVISTWVSVVIAGLAGVALLCAICAELYVLGHQDAFRVFERAGAGWSTSSDTVSSRKPWEYSLEELCEPETSTGSRQPPPSLVNWKFHISQAVKKRGSHWGGVVQGMSHVNGRTVYEVYSGTFGSRSAFDEDELELWSDYPELKFKDGDHVRITSGANKGRTGRILARQSWVPPEFGLYQIDDDATDAVLREWQTQLESIGDSGSQKFPLGIRVRITNGVHKGKTGTLALWFKGTGSGGEAIYGVREPGEDDSRVLYVVESWLQPVPEETASPD